MYVAVTENPPLESGIDQSAIDPTVRPQDDFFRAINGKWLNEFEIPQDKAQYASFTALHDAAEEQLKDIIMELADASVDVSAAAQTPAEQITILYQDMMDVEKLNDLGIAPIAGLLQRVDDIDDSSELAAAFGDLGRDGVRAPVGIYVHQDNKNATEYICDVQQSGLGLPDRDFYLEDKFAEVRSAYREYLKSMVLHGSFVTEEQVDQAVDEVLALETAIAEVSWDNVRNRDPELTYNKMSVNEATGLGPALNIRMFLTASDVPTLVSDVNVGQPDFLTGLSALIESVPLDTWKTYLKLCVLTSFAPLLTKDIDATNFAFYGTTLSGVPQQRERWKRAVSLIDGHLGEALGQLYVERHFPPENKARMVELVDNLIAAYADAIDELEWMTQSTKQAAHEKLATFRPKIGYPDTWRDYSALRFTPGELVANVIRANQFEHDRNVAKLGKPVDRDEWFMPPQMVNAYYNPEMNEIVFPAAILQPPFFTMSADDAVNYGGIGAVIGHEISHGFDDKGSQYDGEGNLRNWWTEADAQAFEERTKALATQYSAYEPVEGHPINGELTLGENIADVSGLAVAFRAYQRSLGDRPAPVIDGMTGEQRFFAGWAQVWRAKTREPEEIRRLATDPHSPPEYRVLGVLVNSAEFMDAFGVSESDEMWRDPADRIRIW